jgi:hypothetical protein
MQKRKLLLSVLSLLVMLALSGCVDIFGEIYHRPDNSGRMVIEYVFPEEILSLGDEDLDMEAFREEMLAMTDMDETFDIDDPNILSVRTEDFIDPDTGSLHLIMEMEIKNMLEPFGLDEQAESPMKIEANPDGTYRFSMMIEPGEEMMMEEEEEYLNDLKPLLEGTVFSWKLHVQEFVDGDQRAIYTPGENVVTWKLSMSDLFNLETDYEFWAVYRTEATEVIEEEPAVDVAEPETEEAAVETPGPDGVLPTPPQGDGFLGLPNWVPFVLAGLCCLGLVAVVVVILVIVVLKKRNKPTQPPSLV